MNENLQNENSTPLETQNVTPNVPQNNMEGEAKPKKNNKKIIIGIVAIAVVLVAVVFVVKTFLLNDPKEVFESSITSVFNYMEQKTNEYVPNEINLEKKDLKVTGTVSFDTNQDLGELEDLKNYAFDMDLEISLRNKILKGTFAFLENGENFLSANSIIQDGKAYVQFPELFPDTLDMGAYDWDSSISITSPSYTKEDCITVIRGTKEMLIASINKEKITSQKGITLAGSDEKVTEISYVVDKETYEQMLESFYNYMTSHNDYVVSLAKLTDSDTTAILDAIKEAKENNEYTGELEINIYTSGLQNEIVSVTMDDGETTFEVKKENEQYIITMNNNSFTVSEINNVLTIDFDMEGYTGTITIHNNGSSENSSNYTINALINYDDISFELKIDCASDYNANVEKEEIGTTVDINNLTEEQSNTILANLFTKIEGTPFETFLEYFVIGQSDETDDSYTY
ncbi:TPA: hypothetical protein IAB95_03525 [Candidatus Ventrenecus avicola]|nr:hypothetical protein [Candidatus Ventrenecus avicola]